MKNKILLIILALFLVAGTAYSAGKTVNVYVNGVQVKSGQIIDGQTMLPLRAVAEALGASVEWDGKTYSARITTPQNGTQAVTEGLSLAQLNKIGESVAKVYAINSVGQTIATGSAFVTKNTVVTNSHVLDGAASIRVEFVNEEQTYRVTDAIFNDADKDLAGFRYTGSVRSLPLSAGELKKGDTVYAIGFPHGRFTLSEGPVGAIIKYDYSHKFIVSTARVDPGSSGGVLVGSDGKVVGVIRGGYEGYSNALHFEGLIEELNRY